MGQSPGLASSRSDDALGALAARVRPVALARQQQLPVLPALAPLLTGGALRRGATVSIAAAPPPAVASPATAPASVSPRSRRPAGRGTTAPEAAGRGVGREMAVASAGGVGVGTVASPGGVGVGAGGAASLALALAAGPSQAGSWVAAVGLGSLGLVAAAELGVALDRLVLVDEPERGQWASVVAALVDGFDVVMVAAGPRARRRPADVRRLAARVRERGAVLVAVGGDLPERSHVRLAVEAGPWEGLEPGGLGRLSARRAVVVAGGRGEASRPRRVRLWLPSATGEVAPADPVAPAVPLDRHRRPSSPDGPRSWPGGGADEGEWDDLVGTAG